MSTPARTLTFRWLATGCLLLSLAACDTAPTRVDQHFGLALQDAQTQQTLDPAAQACRSANWHDLKKNDKRRNWHPYPCLRQRDQGNRIDRGSDGISALSAVERYQQSFQTPPATAPIFNIGLGAASAP